jgi:hypothetical protein
MASSGNVNYESPNFPHPSYENPDLTAHMEALKKTDEALRKGIGEGTEATTGGKNGTGKGKNGKEASQGGKFDSPRV